MKNQFSHSSLVIAVVCSLSILTTPVSAQKRLRDYGVKVGVMKTGANNAITDVKGVKVGHVTIRDNKEKCTGVTAIIPIEENIFVNKLPAGVYIGNGFGKMAGISQVMELGTLETPIVLTNTLNVAEGIAGLVEYTIKENPEVRSVNALVGETNDGGLNNIQGRFVTKEDVLKAIYSAKSGKVAEGCVGAGTGTKAFGYKAGIGTASRVLPKSMGGYTVGVLVQANFGGVLQIAGTPIGQINGNYSFHDKIINDVDGSCMIIVITDAPVSDRNLERMAKRAFMGLAQTGGIASNGSGDYALAVSVAKQNFVTEKGMYRPEFIQNDDMSGLFLATIEATSEAIWNALFAAEDTKGWKGSSAKAIDKQATANLILKSQKAIGLK